MTLQARDDTLDKGKIVVARWEAKGGKRFFKLMRVPHTREYQYRTDIGFGFIGNYDTDEEAISYCERSTYLKYMPDDFPSTKRVV